MSVDRFPAAFGVEGDPEAVRETGRAYGRFATTAAGAARSLRGLDSSGWVGTEGDLFRVLVAQIPPHLDTAHAAFAQVAAALGRFAEELAAAQRQMARIRADAEQTFQALQGARVRSSQLQTPTAEQVQGDPRSPTGSDERKRDLDNRVGQLEDAFNGHLGVATAVHARLLEAARQAGGQIRAAARTSPTADQNRLEDAWENGKRWLDERLDRRAGGAVMRAGGKAVDWVREQQMGVLRGFGEGVVGIGQGLVTAFKLGSPVYGLVDPDGQRKQYEELAGAGRFAVEHPTEFLKAVANWEDLEAGRYGEWFGNLGPDVLLAAATAGAGGAATAASRAARAADAVGDVAKAARDADRAADAARAARAVRGPAQPPAVKPSVTDPNLQNIVRDLYKGTTNPNRVGAGTTADAIRNELRTGQRTGGRMHSQKGRQYARALEKWLQRNPNASAGDRTVARQLLDDLRQALRGN